MNLRRMTICATVTALTAVALACMGHGGTATRQDAAGTAKDTAVDTAAMGINPMDWEGGKAVMPDSDEQVKYKTLTDADFEIVARELGVEVAAIKAVVRIEAGAAMEGFWAPGVPIVNFDRSMYRKYGSKAVNKRGDKNAKVPAGLTGYPLRKWTTLTKMRRINAEGADMGTFWGMFQIGGLLQGLRMRDHTGVRPSDVTLRV